MKIIKDILQKLSEGYTHDLDLSIGDLIYHPYKLLYGDLKKYYRSDSLNHSLKKAEKRGWVKKQIINEALYIALTDLGKENLIHLNKSAGLQLRRGSSEGWDGKYRLVIFDIPERNRVVRDTLRRKLKEFGFVGWQKSVWVTRQDVTKNLRKFLEENNLDDYILVIETGELGNKKLEELAKLASSKN